MPAKEPPKFKKPAELKKKVVVKKRPEARPRSIRLIDLQIEDKTVASIARPLLKLLNYRGEPSLDIKPFMEGSNVYVGPLPSELHRIIYNKTANRVYANLSPGLTIDLESLPEAKADIGFKQEQGSIVYTVKTKAGQARILVRRNGFTFEPTSANVLAVAELIKHVKTVVTKSLQKLRQDLRPELKVTLKQIMGAFMTQRLGLTREVNRAQLLRMSGREVKGLVEKEQRAIDDLHDSVAALNISVAGLGIEQRKRGFGKCRLCDGRIGYVKDSETGHYDLACGKCRARYFVINDLMRYGVLRETKPSVAFVRAGICEHSRTAQGKWYFYGYDNKETGIIYVVDLCLDPVGCKHHGQAARLLQDRDAFDKAKSGLIAFDPKFPK